MEDNFEEPFEVTLEEDRDPSRTSFYIYNGLLDSQLFNAHEVLILVHLIGFADNNEIDQINRTVISINKLSKKTGISKATVCKYIKSLEEKGVLIKKNRVSKENGYIANVYDILNFISVWDCTTLDELKKETDKIKGGIENGG